jgi:2-polyprenyl-3-methyl-5-hydroxy-6-metoxy-1,4-benzoquinol methylase
VNTLSVAKRAIRAAVNRLGFDVVRCAPTPAACDPFQPALSPYVERVEYGPSNIETKLENVRQGLPFELPDIVNLNLAVVSLLGDARRIAELGAGTGTFATAAAADQRRRIVASEFDRATHEWATASRSRPNVEYLHGPIPADQPAFDVVVAIEIIEHIADYRGFLTECTRLSDRALITTPNRARSLEAFHAGPPPYIKHVREWTAGEFYWVLRAFYDQVLLYGMTSQTVPAYVAVNVDTRLSPLIADCRLPTRGG